MKQNRTLIIVLLVLTAIAVFFILKNRKATYSEELSSFAIEDTASVTKIFLADKLGHSVTLKRTGQGVWMVNDRSIARRDAINTLLYTIKHVDVRSPVGRSAMENTIKLMSANAIKCEIYSGDKNLITYYVGTPTQDLLGTFMYIQGSSVPFVTHIPGFNGYLTTRYFTSELEWRERYVFNVLPNKIKKIQVTDRDVANATFSLVAEQPGNFKLYDASNAPVSDANTDRIKMYVSYYSDMRYEGFTDIMRKEMFDSLITVGAFRIIDLSTADKKVHVEFFRKPITERSLAMFDETGQPPEYDMDRMFARINNDTIMVTTQYHLFDKLFKTVNDFRK